MALLLGVWLVENVRKHVVIFDCKRTSLEIVHMTHYQSKDNVLDDKNEHQSNAHLRCPLVYDSIDRYK